MAINPEQRQSGMITRKGQLLKEAREAKGITIATVHEMTKIPLDVLHAIEEGYTVRMVSAYYFKGFIKMYAKFLDLDPRLVLDESLPSRTSQSVEETVPEVPLSKPQIRLAKFDHFIQRQSKKNLIFTIVVSVVAVVGLILIINFVKNMGDKAPLQPKPLVKKEQPKKKVVVPPPPVVEKKVQKAPAPPKEKEEEKPKAKVKPPEEKPVAKAVPTPAVEESRSQPVQENRKSTGKVNLTIKARTTGWLQVKVDGGIVFQSTMHEGTTETWQADNSIELSGKNINNLEFEVNGKMLGQLSKSDRGARRVIVTNEGLSVRK